MAEPRRQWSTERQLGQFRLTSHSVVKVSGGQSLYRPPPNSVVNLKLLLKKQNLCRKMCCAHSLPSHTHHSLPGAGL